MSITADTSTEVEEDFEPDQRSQEQKNLDALQMAMTRTIAETFGLCGEEQIWLLYQIGVLLEPLQGQTPQMVSIATLNELNRTKTAMLTNIDGYVTSHGVKLIHDPGAAQASLDEWASVMVNLIVSSYNITDLFKFQTKTRMMGILSELGVGNPHNPRPSRYLPNDVRHLMNS